MSPEHAESVAAAHALDEALARHAHAGEVDRLGTACYADDALVPPPTPRSFEGAARSAGFPAG